MPDRRNPSTPLSGEVRRPLTERFDARGGEAGDTAAELQEAMRHFAAVGLMSLYTPEPEPDAAAAPRPARSRRPWRAPLPRLSYH